uniref:NADH-ubiquinone oxidoreductase chain 2 n=1 Tax=Craugastor trachydermus TaxID=228427 RepID=Q53EF7_9NEOB|nr:NADH dehydrogenase subunit II [Craugastor trachydermus]
MNPYTLPVIMSSLTIGTMMTISSHHWVLAWVGLEINTMAILPLMTKTPHPRAIEAATKYFLTQATASALILFSSTMNAWITGEWDIAQNCDGTPTTLLSIALAMKLGIAPFHFWIPDVMQGLTFQTGWILSTWQKLAPMTLLFQISQATNLNLMLTMGLMSTALAGWGGVNQTQTRKILAFSSITHLGWMVAVLKLSPHLTLLNFYLYIIMSSSLFLAFLQLNTKNIFEVSTSWSKASTLTPITLLLLLSLGGLPPLTGFLPKWLITQEMVKQHLTLFATTILLMSLISMFFYLRLAYTMTLTLAPNSSISPPSWLTHPKNISSTLMILALMLLPLTPATLLA